MADWLKALREKELKKLLDEPVRAMLKVVESDNVSIDELGDAITSQLPHLAAEHKKEMAKGLWPKTKSLLYRLICEEDPDLEALREMLATMGSAAAPDIVRTIAKAFNVELGGSIDLTTQLVVLCLYNVIRMGADNWCPRQKKLMA